MPQIRPIGVSGSIPSVNQLALGDIAINTYDGKAYIKKAIGSTQSIIQLGSGTGGSSVSASYALSSSYAANGGVTQLIAGTNVTLSPTDGKGAVTVNATISSSGSGTPNGPLYSLQYNNGGLFSGSVNFTLLGNNALYLTGSFNVSGSTFFTGSVSSLNGFTGSLFGTSSWAISASRAISSSYAFNATSASYAVSSSQATSASYAVSSSYALSSSYSVSSSYALSSSYGLSSSFASTASYVATASYVPTLAQVTTAGNTTTNAITVGGLTVATNLIYTDTVNGRVGIGTTSPAYKIDVVGGIRAATGTSIFKTVNNGQIVMSDLGDSQAALLFADNNGYPQYGNIKFYDLSFRNGSATVGKIFSTGNWGINTTTDAGYKLDVNGSLLVKGSGATSSTTAVLVQNSSNTNLLTIRDDGNVRIGAGSPSFTLDVSGSGRFTNNLTVTGSTLVTGSLTVSGSTTISDNLTVNGNATLNGTAVVISPPSIQLPGLTGAYSPSPSVRTVMFDTLNNALFITSSLPGGGAGTTTGSFTGSFTGSLLGTASFATFALGAGTANTASYVLNTVSSSFASTASFVVLAQTASYVTLAQTASFALNAVSASYAPAGAAFPYVGTARITGSLLVSGSITSTDTITSGLDVIANQNLKSMNQSGDEGGEIFLNVPATNTTIPGGVTIDVYQNRLRIFEQGGAANGYYLDMPSGGPGVSTDLSPAGYTGTVTILGNPPGQQNLNYTNGILISVT